MSNKLVQAAAEGSPANPARGPAALPARTITDLTTEIEGIWNDIQTLQRKAYLLMGDIDSSFDLQRAREADEHSATFMFQKRGIDAIEWLAGEVWSDAADLEEKANKLYDRLEALQ